MRRRAILAALAWLVATGAVAQPGRPTPSLDDTLREHLRALQARDLAALERTVTAGERLELILADGRRSTTRAEYLAHQGDSIGHQGHNEVIRPLSRLERGDVAVVTARARHEDREAFTLGRWTEDWRTLVFAREAGGWRLVQDQATRIRAGALARPRAD